MQPLNIDNAFDRAVADRRLLEHGYYRRWQHGSLTLKDLSAYAGQYRYFERSLPECLESVAKSLAPGVPKRLVEANLRDEWFRPRQHVDLFEQFAAALGAPASADQAPSTRDLVGLYQGAVSAGPVEALAVIGAYEVQAAQVAATKADALRSHYGLDAEGTEFWDVHAELERSHSEWTFEALRALNASPSTVEEYAALSADAWWAFLDERDAELT